MNNKLNLVPLNKITKSIIILFFILTIITFSLFIFYSNIRMPFGLENITIWNYNINNYSILILTSKICIWFSIGIKLYLFISEGKLGMYLQNKIYIINNLNYLQLTLILFIVFYIISITKDIFILNIINEYYLYNIDYLSDLYMVENQNNTSSNTESSSNTSFNIANSKGDSIILAASLAAGTQLAKNTPSLAGKAAILTTSTALALT